MVRNKEEHAGSAPAPCYLPFRQATPPLNSLVSIGFHAVEPAPYSSKRSRDSGPSPSVCGGLWPGNPRQVRSCSGTRHRYVPPRAQQAAVRCSAPGDARRQEGGGRAGRAAGRAVVHDARWSRRRQPEGSPAVGRHEVRLQDLLQQVRPPLLARLWLRRGYSQVTWLRPSYVATIRTARAPAAPTASAAAHRLRPWQESAGPSSSSVGASSGDAVRRPPPSTPRNPPHTGRVKAGPAAWSCGPTHAY